MEPTLNGSRRRLQADQADVVWAAWLAAGAAYETYTLYRRQHHRTASQTTRRWWRVETPLGRAAFTAVVAWYVGHVMRWWR